jgi:hypothetical protein
MTVLTIRLLLGPIDTSYGTSIVLEFSIERSDRVADVIQTARTRVAAGTETARIDEAAMSCQAH